jgi:RNA polymerase sigma-70 factor (ECF subfamily)
MTQDKSQEAREAGEHAGISEDERQERLTQLERFPAIFAEHRSYVEDLLRKGGVESHEVMDLLQEVFITLHAQILEIGVVDSIPAMLQTLTHHKILNHVHAQQRAPFTLGVPSSTSEKPRSQLDVERALHLQKVARRIYSQLSPEHREVIKKVIVGGLTHTEAAAELGIPEGTLKSRLLAAKRALVAAAEQILPPSQRGPV